MLFQYVKLQRFCHFIIKPFTIKAGFFWAFPQGSGFTLYLFIFDKKIENKKDAVSIPNATAVLTKIICTTK